MLAACLRTGRLLLAGASDDTSRDEVVLRAERRSLQFEQYVEMVKVAVSTAIACTSLVPCFVYDGPENSLTEWLRTRRVTILGCRSGFHERLRSIAAKRGDANILGIGAGALLRVEIPRLAWEAGIRDEIAFYTDVDVMFMSDVCDLASLRPAFFAAAPEFQPSDYRNINTGVMLMNLAALRRVDADFKRYIGDHLEELIERSWDQGAYRHFFARWRAAGRAYGARWDRLSPEFNWKPYWGLNSNAKIVHFHVVKPQQHRPTTAHDRPDTRDAHLALRGGAYKELSEIWHARLAETAATP